MAISVDAAAVTRWAGTPAISTNLTSGTFTPANNSVLVLCIDADTDAGRTTIGLTVSGGSLTWTKQKEQYYGAADATKGGAASVWTAPVGTGASMTVSVQWTSSDGSTHRISCKLYVCTGHDTVTPVGATGAGTSTTNNLTTAGVTGQTAGVMFFAGTEWNALGLPTSSDLTKDAADYASQIDVLSGYKTIASAGASVTANLDAGGSAAAAWAWAAVEVRAAADTLMGQAIF